ncbi:Metal-response element-binding transcription factor 2 [Trichoplax sp. H2]|nr:Metal-response element-binding transcription factor 2 [Trichoplax sp. H2]|eukprot:RDD41121.1 Metal-response element-binding transcription factor 2 [Trichoplax sp. H2]
MNLNKKFPHAINDVIIVKCQNNYYYAKIKSIDKRRRKCKVLFDDKSTDDLPFSDIYSVGDTTTEIVCIVCKSGSSESPNEIVLCDRCSIGYHQQCHSPQIPESVLKPDVPWLCHYCQSSEICPYFVKNPFTDDKGGNFNNKKKPIDKKLRKNPFPDPALTSPKDVVIDPKKSATKNTRVSIRKTISKRKRDLDTDESEQETAENEDEEEDGDVDYQDTFRKRRRAAVVARKRVQKYMKETGVASDTDTENANTSKKNNDADFNINSVNTHGSVGIGLLTENRISSSFPMASSGGFGTSPNLSLNNNYSMSGVRIQSPVMMPQMNSMISDHAIHNNPNQIFNMANGLMKSPPVHSPTLGTLTSPMGNDMQTSPTFVNESFQSCSNVNQPSYYQPQPQAINNIDYQSQPLSGYNSSAQNFTNPSHMQLSPQMTPQYPNPSHVYSQHHSHHVPSMIHSQDPHYQHFPNFHNMPSQEVAPYGVSQYNQYHWLGHPQQPQTIQHMPSSQYAVSPIQSVSGSLGMTGPANQQFSIGQPEQAPSQKLSHSTDHQLSTNNLPNVTNFNASNSFAICNETKDNIDKLNTKEVLSISTEASILDVATKTPTIRGQSKKSDTDSSIEKETVTKVTTGEQFETAENLKPQVKAYDIPKNKQNDNHNSVEFHHLQESNSVRYREERDKDVSHLNTEIFQKQTSGNLSNATEGNRNSVIKESSDNPISNPNQTDKTSINLEENQICPKTKVKKDGKDDSFKSDDGISKNEKSKNESNADEIKSKIEADASSKRNKMNDTANSSDKSATNEPNQQICDSTKDSKDGLKHAKEQRNLEEVDNKSNNYDKDIHRGRILTDPETNARGALDNIKSTPCSGDTRTCVINFTYASAFLYYLVMLYSSYNNAYEEKAWNDHHLKCKRIPWHLT